MQDLTSLGCHSFRVAVPEILYTNIMSVYPALEKQANIIHIVEEVTETYPQQQLNALHRLCIYYRKVCLFP